MNWYKKAKNVSDIMRELIEKSTREKQQAINLSKGTGNNSVQLSNKDNSRGAMINKSGRMPGKWQSTWFDNKGFYGDTTFDTKEEAIIEAFKEGFIIQKDLIAEFNKDPKFSKGNEFTMVLQIANQFGGKLSFEILDAYEKGGVEAAKNKVKEIKNRQQEKDNVKKAQTLESVDAIMQKWQQQGITLSIFEQPNKLILDSIIVPKDRRKQGIGSQIMEELVNYSDKVGKRLELSPGQRGQLPPNLFGGLNSDVQRKN